MAIQQTSLMAYRVEVIPKIGRSQERILKTLKEINKGSNMMIAQALGWSINRVTPRINELRKEGLVVFDSVNVCSVTGRFVNYWRLLL